MRLARFALPLAAAALLAACETVPPLTPPPPVPPPASPPPPSASAPAPGGRFDAVPRADFNRIALELDLPLFWIADRNSSGAVDPDEVATLWGIAPPVAWTQAGAFTPAFKTAYDAIAKVKAEGHPRAGLEGGERRRRDAVLLELAQGRPSLVASDFRGASEEDRGIVRHVLAAAQIIERIYAKQRGSEGLAAGIPEGDTASRALFWRNQGPWCELPKTEKDPDCSAVPGRPAHVPGLYPASIQKDPKFCEALEARKDEKVLLEPFSVVVEEKGELRAVPYHVAYKAEMEAVSRELKAAAEAVKSPEEAALKAYLGVAAQAFLDGKWSDADEAWAKMSVLNSKWYLRIGPDETYADPCSRKAGFHVSFAKINQGSLEWQKKLEPLKAEMEAALAKLAGPPYRARSVTFHLPDFIDIVLNAGDSRNASGGTVGQSLPNWGPVANEGRGRTVAMTNLFQDADSKARARDVASSLLCKASMPLLSEEPGLGTMSTVLHEAAHNLGPAHEYKVQGKTDDQIFGGPLAATFEELKAQTAALYFTGWLVKKGVIDQRTAQMANAGDVIWAFGHIAQGMYTADGKPKPYSQLAAIQVGSLLEAKAIAWKADELAANGKDKGCFELDTGRLPGAIDELAKIVLGIKGRGDKAGAVKLRERLVDAGGEWKELRAIITERGLRSPKGSLVYSIEL